MNKRDIGSTLLTQEELEELERLMKAEFEAQKAHKAARQAISKFLDDRPAKSRDIFKHGDYFRKTVLEKL